MRTVISTEEMQDAKLIACGFGICEDDEEVGAYLHGVLVGYYSLTSTETYSTRRLRWSYGAGRKVGQLLNSRKED